MKFAKSHHLSIRRISIGVCLIILLIIVYLFALNGRYAKYGNGNVVFDKWKKEAYIIGSKEIPVIKDGVDIYNREE
jgi:uncharacterized membrane protein YqiK